MITASSKSASTKVCIFYIFSPVIIRTENILLTLNEFWNLFFSQTAKEKHFLYDIVANGRNGIDVDK